MKRNYSAGLIALRDERNKAQNKVDRLKAENARLRAALEAAPHPDLYPPFIDYLNWWHGKRAEALEGKAE